MFGWAGTILHVDLSSGNVRKEPLDPAVGKEYLGGRGINAKIFYEEVGPGVDAFSPENLIIFGAGPLGGTFAPSGNRMSVTAKSPMYNGMGTSNVGGRFGPELKYAGYDHLVIRGKADEPVFLWIDDDQVEIRSARHLWGKSTWETDKMIREELRDPEIKVAAIGQAGETLVRYSAILFSMYRAAGQTGMGAVMGSKNLKAIAVRGTGSIAVANPELLKKFTQETTLRVMKNPAYQYLSVHGTPYYMEMADQAGVLSVRNYQEASPWEGAKNFSTEKISEFYTKDKSCHACPMHCSHYFEVKEGLYKGEKGAGIEGGLVYPFGPTIGNTNLPALFKIINLCNQYGIDCIEMGFTIATAMEWYEKGIITRKDTDGIAMEWGNAESAIEVIHKVARREGFGDLLAEGGLHAARTIGKDAEYYFNHCKGMGIGSDDPRATKATILSFSTSTIPAHHEEGNPPPMSPKRARTMFGSEEVVNPVSYNEKAAYTVYFQNLSMALDSVEVCKFISGWVNEVVHFQELADLFTAATGVEMDVETLRRAAERIQDLERAFAVREGMSRADDRIQGKIVAEPVRSGPFKGERIDPEGAEKMLDEYYEVKGWDKATGIPTRAKLEMDGLKSVADELERMGKLP